MADPQAVAAEISMPSGKGSPHGSPSFTLPVRHDTASSDGSDKYTPIPAGRWTVDFHGNCPRCHHHHSSVRIKVNNALGDVSQVSYVHCEKCKERWAAFGGRNTTRISLLSTTTTDPDPIEEKVRHSLIDIVKSATAVASLGGIPELSAHLPSRQSSVRSPTHDRPNAAPQSWKPVTSAVRVQPLSPPKLVQYHNHNESSTPLSDQPATAIVKRNRASRLFLKVKQRFASHFPMLHRVKAETQLGGSEQAQVSARKYEKSPILDPLVEETPKVVPYSSVVPHAHSEHNNIRGADPEVPVTDIPESSRTNAAAADYICSLDIERPNSLSVDRASWMREKYTAFKARDKESDALLSFSKIFHTSIQYEPPRLEPGSINRRSVEVLGTGTHIEGLERIESNPTRSWGRSISISEGTSDATTACDEQTISSYPRFSRQEILQRERRGSGPQRPLSLPNVPRQFQHLRHFRDEARLSFDSLIHGGSGRSTSSTRGQASVRLSRGSMVRASTPSVRECWMSQTSLHQSVDQEIRRSDEADSPPSPPPNSQQNAEQSGPP